MYQVVQEVPTEQQPLALAVYRDGALVARFTELDRVDQYIRLVTEDDRQIEAYVEKRLDMRRRGIDPGPPGD